MTFNRANALRLRQAILDTPAERFDYRSTDAECGCVVPIARRLDMYQVGGFVGLGLKWNEVHYLTAAGIHIDIGPGKSFYYMTEAEATGEAGKAEAVRRLDVILARHPEEA